MWQANTDDMAKIEYAFPVETVHGKISKKHKIGFAHRTASGVNYSTMYGKRRTKPSTAEIANREKFATVRANIESLSEEQIAEYAAQFKKYPGKYKSLNGYIFAKEYEKIGS